MKDYTTFLNERLEPKSQKILDDLNQYIGNEKPNSPELQFYFKEMLKSALRDANDHDSILKVDSIFPKAKFGYDDNLKSTFLDRFSSKGIEHSKMAKWDPFHIYSAYNEFAKKKLSKFDILTPLLDEIK